MVKDYPLHSAWKFVNVDEAKVGGVWYFAIGLPNKPIEEIPEITLKMAKRIFQGFDGKNTSILYCWSGEIGGSGVKFAESWYVVPVALTIEEW